MRQTATRVRPRRRFVGRRRYGVAALAVVTGTTLGLAFLLSPLAAADAGPIAPLNADRAKSSFSRLAESAPLDQLALRHSEEMASENRLYHTPDLMSAVTAAEPDWQKAGENVG